jgi:hypothetical protein
MLASSPDDPDLPHQGVDVEQHSEREKQSAFMLSPRPARRKTRTFRKRLGPIAAVLLFMTLCVYALYWLGSQQISGHATVSAIRLQASRNDSPYEIHGFRKSKPRP